MFKMDPGQDEKLEQKKKMLIAYKSALDKIRMCYIMLDLNLFFFICEYDFCIDAVHFIFLGSIPVHTV